MKQNFRWAYLEIRTSQKAKDEDQAYGAGYLEGTLTADLIYSYWFNTAKGYCTDRPNVCQQLKDYMTTNKNWIISKSNESDPYWYQVCYFFFQSPFGFAIHLKWLFWYTIFYRSDCITNNLMGCTTDTCEASHLVLPI